MVQKSNSATATKPAVPAASATVTGAALKQLLSDLTKFPSIGSFVGSELVNFQVGGGSLVASTFGVVTSRSKIEAEGSFPLTAVDERVLLPFASLCSPDAKVRITLDGNMVKFRSGAREVAVAKAPGTMHKVDARSIAQAVKGISLTKEHADTLGYLASVAFSDSSRPDLQAVMLAPNGFAIAVNQKMVASLACDVKVANAVALPIPMSKILSPDAVLFAAPAETLLQTASAYYAMPSPVKAQREFPLQAVESYYKLKQRKVAGCTGKALYQVAAECNSCLSAIARTETVLKLTLGADRIEVSAENGGARFRSAFKATPADGVEGKTLFIPLQELMNVAPVLETRDAVLLTVAVDGNQLFIRFEGGWLLFPTWE